MVPLVILPTYNEAENIEKMIKAVLECVPSAHILVVDDNSPDGTADIVAHAGSQDKRIHILQRKGKRGRGLAGVAGFKWALEKGFDPIIEMDADFSHDPEDLPRFLEASKHFDLIIGSRYVRGGKVEGVAVSRRILSYILNFLMRIVFGLRAKDVTSGYRCFRRKVLVSIDLDGMKCEGPGIVEEILYKCAECGCTIKEIPIIFRKRKLGTSKVSPSLLLEGLFEIVAMRNRV